MILILRDLIPFLYSNFEVYCNDKYYGEFEYIRNDINKGSFEYILDLGIEEIAVKGCLITIHVKE